jgi:hypothetical protein
LSWLAIGIARGRVVGVSDRIGGDVTSTPISPKDILATILHQLRIDHEQHVLDKLTRPTRIVGEGQPRLELI